MSINRLKIWLAVVLMAITALDGAGAIALCIGSDGQVDLKANAAQLRSGSCNGSDDEVVYSSQISNAQATTDWCVDIPLGSDDKMPTVISSADSAFGKTSFVHVADIDGDFNQINHTRISLQTFGLLAYSYHWPLASVVLLI